MLALVEGTPAVELDKTRQRVRERLAIMGISANDASRRANLGLSYVNDLLTAKSKNPVPHRLAQLAAVLDCDLDYLTGDQSTPRATAAPAHSTSEAHVATMPLINVGPRGVDGFYSIPKDTNAVVPAVLGGADPDTYALIVPDDANAPRYFAGELVIASPRVPASRGAFAVIHTTDGRAAIRRVEAILSGVVKVSTLEDADSIVDIPREQIESVHKIIGTAEHRH